MSKQDFRQQLEKILRSVHDDARGGSSLLVDEATAVMLAALDGVIGPDEPHERREDGIAGKEYWNGRVVGINAERQRLRKALGLEAANE